jgi:hypothetical protein
MADADDLCRLALSLPHAEEIDSDGFDFRVGGRGFVWSYPERRAGEPRRLRTDVAVLYVGDEGEKQALLLGEPEIFFTTPEYNGWPLVLLRLAKVDVERLTELVTDAWRMRAPEALTADSGAGGLSPGLVAGPCRGALSRGLVAGPCRGAFVVRPGLCGARGAWPRDHGQNRDLPGSWPAGSV